VEEGKPLTQPANPAKEGYTFAGWYTESTCITPWNFATDGVLKDTTLYAKWLEGEDIPSFTVTFNAEGGTPAPEQQTVVQGEKALAPEKPAKTGWIFDGWYNGNAKWDFSTNTVTAAVTLQAKWLEAVTLSFDTQGGSTIAPLPVAKGSEVSLSYYTPSKEGFVFDGWYTNKEYTSPVELDGGRLTLTVNMTVYAKWTSTAELAPYTGVWRSGDRAYILLEGGICWEIRSNEWSKGSWTPSTIGNSGVSFTGDTFTLDTVTYTRNTTETRTPAAAASDLLGGWLGKESSGSTLELKSDATAVISYGVDTLTLGYAAEGNRVYLLQKDGNQVILSITLNEDCTKAVSDPGLAGIWKLTRDGQDYYYDLKADGTGTFHTLGAAVEVKLAVTQGKIDGMSYTVSGDILKVTYRNGNEEIEVTYTKVASIPPGSGAGGDPRLLATWKGSQGSISQTLIFNEDGTIRMEQTTAATQLRIWKADGSKLHLYSPSMRGNLSSPLPYSISGSSLEISDFVFTRQ
jgi:uncharacterized repeat protein (TIGR02543 family)